MQPRVELDSQSELVVGLEAQTLELEKQLEYEASQVRGAASKYSPLYDELQTMKQRLYRSVSCDREMEQRLINTSKDVLENMDVVHLKVVKSQNTVR